MIPEIYLNFSFPQMEVFWTRFRGNLHSSTKESIFDGFFCNFLEINPFTKNCPDFEDKGVAVPDKILSILKGKKSDPKMVYVNIWGLGPKS